MKTFHYTDAPIKVFGIPFFEEKKELRRLPEEITESIERLSYFGRRCAGARLCFRTDAKEFTLKMEYESVSIDKGMSLFSCQSAFVLAGDRANPTYLGLAGPDNYDTTVFEKNFKKSDCMEDITIWFPRNEVVTNIEITIDDTAKIEEPTPYMSIKPILYYGSSITEGGHSTTCFNGYNAILSSRLNVDYYNLGFSGSAYGEPEIAEYINTIDFSIFVYDYDHNAPDVEHLEKTHQPFFEIIRKAHPYVPVLMLTRPAVKYNAEEVQRRKIVETTYMNAKNNGDKNVYFIDGESYFGDTERFRCTLDGTHPNDIGMLRMANTIEPVLREIISELK